MSGGKTTSAPMGVWACLRARAEVARSERARKVFWTIFADVDVFGYTANRKSI